MFYHFMVPFYYETQKNNICYVIFFLVSFNLSGEGWPWPSKWPLFHETMKFGPGQSGPNNVLLLNANVKIIKTSWT